jgi:CheY-like chemotaxis protein
MDQVMPEMDGIETARLIRESAGPCAAVPIVALTANAIKGASDMFLENHFDDYLPKPLEIEALNLCLRKWLPNEIIHEQTAG